jgi:hypothetical protein
MRLDELVAMNASEILRKPFGIGDSKFVTVTNPASAESGSIFQSRPLEPTPAPLVDAAAGVAGATGETGVARVDEADGAAVPGEPRIAALRLGDPRVMALLAAVVMVSHLPAGFSNAQLRRHIAALLSTPLGGTRAPA